MKKTFIVRADKAANRGFVVARHEGQVVFIRGGLPGETLRVTTVKSKKSHSYARTMEVIEPSVERTEAVCPHFGPGRCGGCHWQHLRYESHLSLKHQILEEQLARIGGHDTPRVLPVKAAAQPLQYRVHATLSRSFDGALGFRSDDASGVVAIRTCSIMHPALLDAFKSTSPPPSSVSRLRLQIGCLPGERVAMAEESAEGTTPGPRDPSARPFKFDAVEGSRILTYEVSGRRFQITPGVFFQANLSMTSALVDAVLERLELEGRERVLDLYGGAGLFAKFIAPAAGHVVCVESSQQAARDAGANLKEHSNVSVVTRRVEELRLEDVGPAERVVVDPPRTGLSRLSLRLLTELGPRQIVYVSCDPATLARDSRVLVDAGYEMEPTQPLDLFPQTFHIESVTSFRTVSS